MSRCNVAKCSRLSHITKAKGIQDRALDNEQYDRALGYRSASPYLVLSGIPRPNRWVNGARVWEFH